MSKTILRTLSSSPKLLRTCHVRTFSPYLNSARQYSPYSRTIVCGQRSYVTKSTTDEKIENIQELFATAKDEFEMASEETEKKTVYAADDRAAAHEELAKLKTAFEEAIKGEGEGEGLNRLNRIGQHVRELENAVANMDELAKED